MAKAEFKWDETQEVGTVQISEKKKVEITFNMLEKEGEENWYVSIATLGFFKRKTQEKESWQFEKNATFPLEVWKQISDIIIENLEEE